MTDAAPDHQLLRFTAIVSGYVQGVGYRAFVRSTATGLDVAGHVENLADGRVEIVAEGHKPDLELLLVRMNTGTTHAEVERIDVEWAEAGGLKGFYVY